MSLTDFKRTLRKLGNETNMFTCNLCHTSVAFRDLTEHTSHCPADTGKLQSWTNETKTTPFSIEQKNSFLNKALSLDLEKTKTDQHKLGHQEYRRSFNPEMLSNDSETDFDAYDLRIERERQKEEATKLSNESKPQQQNQQSQPPHQNQQVQKSTQIQEQQNNKVETADAPSQIFLQNSVDYDAYELKKLNKNVLSNDPNPAHSEEAKKTVAIQNDNSINNINNTNNNTNNYINTTNNTINSVDTNNSNSINTINSVNNNNNSNSINNTNDSNFSNSSSPSNNNNDPGNPSNNNNSNPSNNPNLSNSLTALHSDLMNTDQESSPKFSNRFAVIEEQADKFSRFKKNEDIRQQLWKFGVPQQMRWIVWPLIVGVNAKKAQQNLPIYSEIREKISSPEFLKTSEYVSLIDIVSNLN